MLRVCGPPSGLGYECCDSHLWPVFPSNYFFSYVLNRVKIYRMFFLCLQHFNASLFFVFSCQALVAERCPCLPIFPLKLCERNAHWPILHEEKSSFVAELGAMTGFHARPLARSLAFCFLLPGHCYSKNIFSSRKNEKTG